MNALRWITHLTKVYVEQQDYSIGLRKSESASVAEGIKAYVGF